MMETPLDKESTKVSSDPGTGKPSCFLGTGNVAWNAAGINKPAVANAINDDMVWATVWLNVCCTLVSPPATKQQPNTNNKFDKMDPNILAWTILTWFSFNAMMDTINSTALPNVAFNKPPMVWPTFSDNSSVAYAKSDANGTMAKKLIQKMALEPHPKWPANNPMGTNTKR